MAPLPDPPERSPGSSSSPGIRLESISHAYAGVRVVDAVSFAVERGEILCLVGPSGSGKSTTLRVAAGLEPLQDGRVLIDERVVATPGQSVPPELRGVGFMFQEYALFPHLSVIDNVCFGVSGAGAEERRATARATLAQVRMADFAEAYPHTLSGGQQQRVALARALAPKPGVMLMDEPFSNLDFRLRKEVWEDTLGVLRRAGTPTVLVTHDPHEAMRMGDRIAVMHEGRILQTATASDIYNHPATAYVATFFGELTALPGVVQDGHVETPFARLPASGVADGSAVDVLIRSEALHLNLGNGAHAACPNASRDVDATVVAARHMGPYSIVQLFVAPREDAILVARVPGKVLPAPGAILRAHLDCSLAFVFPARALGSR